jgi:hypothetical protein
MSDPYNSYGSALPPAAAPAASHVQPVAARPRDNISKLDVSESWKKNFRLIEKAGGPDLPYFRDLPFGERFGLNFNFLAFLFGPIYLAVKGLWRQAIVYFVLGFTIVLILESMGFSGRIGTGLGFICAMRANTSYYRKVVLGEAPWL